MSAMICLLFVEWLSEQRKHTSDACLAWEVRCWHVGCSSGSPARVRVISFEGRNQGGPLEDDSLVTHAFGHALSIEIFEQRNGVFSADAS